MLEILTRCLVPRLAEILVKVSEHRATYPARYILAGMQSVPAHLRMHTHVAVIVPVPVRIEHVMAHHEANRTLGYFVIDQHHLLMMRGKDLHGCPANRPHRLTLANSFVMKLHSMVNFVPVLQAEVTCSKLDILECLRPARKIDRPVGQ